LEGISLLIVTAISLGFIHTALGPDHYLPFIVMSKARNWSMAKTLRITILSGFAHVLSSVVIGFIGIGAGIAISKIEGFEGIRGDLAAWLFIVFGLAYFIWGFNPRD
jgi:nickel/cobalt exporter